jgi:aldehyde dehydrogenase (NAD+)
MVTYYNVIEGISVEPAGDSYSDVVNPARKNDVIARAPVSNALDVQRAIDACVKAERTWAAVSAPERGRILYKLADLLEDSVDEMALILTKEEGKTLPESRGEIMHAVGECRYIASEAFRLTGTTYPSESQGGMVLRIREPLGTIATINPWNFPVVTPIRKIAPALACGNTVLFKPAQNTPGTGSKLMELIKEAGVPDGVVNLVCGKGSEIGDAICSSPDVKGISFTGSTKVGKHIFSKASAIMARLQLEMGGKNPAIVWNPEDMDFCADQIARSAFGGTGQKCTAISKVIVKSDNHDELVSKLCAFADNIKVGDGQMPGVTMGPLASQQQFDTVKSYMELAHETANVVYGGRVLSDVGDGWFVSPTIATDVTWDHRLSMEEIFGPFLSIIRVDSFDEAIHAANCVEYGLASCIFSTDALKIRQYVNEIKTGMAHVNQQTFVMGHVPFGGIKMSGYGAYSNGNAFKEFYMNEKTLYLA